MSKIKFFEKSNSLEDTFDTIIQVDQQVMLDAYNRLNEKEKERVQLYQKSNKVSDKLVALQLVIFNIEEHASLTAV